mgnify:CR=1 FL=1
MSFKAEIKVGNLEDHIISSRAETPKKEKDE